MIDRRTYGLIWGATFDQLCQAELSKDNYPEGFLKEYIKGNEKAKALCGKVTLLKLKQQELDLQKALASGDVN